MSFLFKELFVIKVINSRKNPFEETSPLVLIYRIFKTNFLLFAPFFTLFDASWFFRKATDLIFTTVN